MQADREKTLRMIKTARGQLDGIIKMVEEDGRSSTPISSIAFANRWKARIARPLSKKSKNS